MFIIQKPKRVKQPKPSYQEVQIQLPLPEPIEKPKAVVKKEPKRVVEIEL
jgi:hypothetical protein